MGAGKTGSTSIQNTLKLNDLKLKKQGVLYLGLTLENATEVKYSWQSPTSVKNEFFDLSEEEAEKQILDVLRPTIKNAKLQNFHTLVWSNERFFRRRYNFKTALKQLQHEGVDIELVVYVRKYDAWALSAYTQWAIKHKVHKGRVKNFHQWIKKTPPRFYETIRPLLPDFSRELKVRNMNAVGDVAKDFIDALGINGEDFDYRRDNISLSNEELLFRALFNDQYHDISLPNRFNQISRRHKKRINFSQTPKDYLRLLMPTDKDLKDVCKKSEQDRRHINEILIEQGQVPLGEESTKIKDADIDNDKILMALVDIVMRQSKQIDQLERIVQKNVNNFSGYTKRDEQ